MLKGIFSGMSTWVKIVFIASLALNLAVVGSFVGHRLGLWKGKHHHGMHKYILSVMPVEKRDQVEKILSSYRAEHPKKRGKFMRQLEKFDTQLRAENFDRAAFMTSFQEEIELHNKRWLAGGKTIADIAVLLTAEERAAALDKIKKKLERKRKYKHRH